MNPGQKTFALSPIRLLVIMIGSLIVAEVSVMFLLRVFPAMPDWLEAISDAIIMVVLSSPVLYFFIFRPLTQHIAERKRAEAALEESQAELEVRIKERTADLEQANQELGKWVGQLERHNREIVLLSEMVNLFAACRNSDEANGVILQFTRQLGGL